MKRDMDTVRELLLRIDDADYLPARPTPQYVHFNAFVRPGEDPDRLSYHLRLLIEAGFAKADPLGFVAISGLTWQGHEFLDSVRDPEIWRKTKEAAAKVGGSTLEILGALAKGFIKTQLEKYTELELDT